MNYEYNLSEIRENLTVEQIMDFLNDNGGEVYERNGVLMSKTICHHPITELAEAGHKLYYYENSCLFHCYTGCEEPSFDIFQLVIKIRKLNQGDEIALPQAVKYIAERYGFSANAIENEDITEIDDYLTSVNNYDRIKNIDLTTKRVELKTYNGNFLKNLPHPIIESWCEENITAAAQKRFNIAFDPKNQGIVIPHYDINGKLIGIRERNLDQERIERYGKYHPAFFNGTIYNHPLSFSLFGIYENKENIMRAGMAILFESEKSVLQMDGILGARNNISCAVCGSNVLAYQVGLLQSLGVREIVIALDRQYKKLNDAEHKKLCRNLRNIHKKFGNYIKISYIFDTTDRLPYKASPSDAGSQIFKELFAERKVLY